MHESSAVKLLTVVGIISVAVIAYTTLALTEIISDKTAVIFLSTCQNPDSLIELLKSDCKDFKEMKDILNLDACKTYSSEKRAACENILGIMKRKADFCSDTINIIERRESYVDAETVKTSCAVLTAAG